jgi:hypothetical protein
LAATENLTGETDTTASALARSYTGYTLTARPSSVPSGTIVGNGSLALHLYYAIDIFVVNFVDFDGTLISQQTVPYGGNAAAPANPTRAAYAFAGWDRAFTNIRATLTVRARYTLLPVPVTPAAPPNALTPNAITPTSPSDALAPDVLTPNALKPGDMPATTPAAPGTPVTSGSDEAQTIASSEAPLAPLTLGSWSMPKLLFAFLFALCALALLLFLVFGRRKKRERENG